MRFFWAHIIIPVRHSFFRAAIIIPRGGSADLGRIQGFIESTRSVYSATSGGSARGSGVIERSGADHAPAPENASKVSPTELSKSTPSSAKVLADDGELI